VNARNFSLSKRTALHEVKQLVHLTVFFKISDSPFRKMLSLTYGKFCRMWKEVVTVYSMIASHILFGS